MTSPDAPPAGPRKSRGFRAFLKRLRGQGGMEPMLAPRILGMANKAWDQHDSLNGDGLRALAQAYAPLFDRMGWQRHGGA